MFSVTEPPEVLFYADSLYGHVGWIDVSRSAMNHADLHLIAYSPRPVGVAYDSVLQVCLHLLTTHTMSSFCQYLIYLSL